MRKLLVVIVSIFAFNLTSFSQQCLPNGKYFNTQVEIDNFETDYPGCIKIGGNVTFAGDEITNFNGLNNLRYIIGDLNFGSYNFPLTQITDFSGLDNLEKVYGDFLIGKSYKTYTPALENFNGLGSLISVGGNMELQGCLALESLDGLDNIDSIGGQLLIKNNNNLRSLFNLPSLSYLGSDLIVVANDVLINPSGLQGLTTIDNSIVIGRKNGQLLNETNLSLVNLEGLNNLTYVGGDLIIENNPSLNSLQGLESLATVGNDFSISYCNSLINLVGPEQLNSVEHLFDIQNNNSLETITGFGGFEGEQAWISISYNDKLNEISGFENLIYTTAIYLSHNDSLITLQAFQNLQRIKHLFISKNKLSNLDAFYNLNRVEEHLSLKYCPELHDISGLKNILSIGDDLLLEGCHFVSPDTLKLVAIGGSLELRLVGESVYKGMVNLKFIEGSLIVENCSMRDFSGLTNLTSIGGSIELDDNRYITSLYGLHNINASELDNLHLYNNKELLHCEIQSICDYLNFPESEVSIWNNSTNCNTVEEIKDACELPIVSCMPAGVIFSSQSELDDFRLNYPDCSQILGDLTIEGEDITSLVALSNISKLGNSLKIENNPNLTSLLGLDELASVNGDIDIKNNSILTDLQGLESIDFNSIENLNIINNASLSNCNITSVCGFLNIPYSNENIYNNAQNCNSKEEVLTECVSMISETNTKSSVSIFPNPASGTITIVNNHGEEINKIIIFNSLGQKVLVEEHNFNGVDISFLKNGIYLLEASTEKYSHSLKFIIKN